MSIFTKKKETTCQGRGVWFAEESSSARAIAELAAALSKEHLSDVSLRGADGRDVPAVRFILAARSRVFERMFYGDFAEATPKSAVSLSYTSVVLEKVVRYCVGADVPSFPEAGCRDEDVAAEMVDLVSAADFFELPGLGSAVFRSALERMKTDPPLAGAVYDNMASKGLKNHELAESALRTIRLYVRRSFLSLKRGGGEWLLSLSGESILDIMSGKLSSMSEWDKFEFVLHWLGADVTGRREVAQKAIEQVALYGIPPSKLSGEVAESGLVDPGRLLEAFKKQALHAEQWGAITVPLTVRSLAPGSMDPGITFHEHRLLLLQAFPAKEG